MNDLEKYFTQNTGRLIHKWKHYFEIYDRHFSRFRGTDVHVVEFGVSQGGSLQMWKRYFGPNAKIFGIDINPDCKKLEEEQIEIICGDQEDRRFLRSLAEKIPRIDILIDDGGHTMKQQINTYQELFSHIHKNGVYLCEDLHSSYLWKLGGGYKKRGTFVEYSKNFIDYINAWHSAKTSRLSVTEFTKSVHSLHYYDSILVIEKRPIERPFDIRTGTPTIPDVQSPESLVKRAIETLRDKGSIALLRRVLNSPQMRWLKFFLLPYAVLRIGRFRHNDLNDLLKFSFSGIKGLIRPSQDQDEILAVLRILDRMKPRIVLEIGTANGGTLFLFSRVSFEGALIMSVDLAGYPKWKIPLYKSFRLPKQELNLIRADSHSIETFKRVETVLNGDKVDFLFIDGDHSYEGVNKDFQMYSTLVKENGVIGFHDIAAQTPDGTHEVTKFWDEIRKKYQFNEIIHNKGSFGIGLLYM